MIKINKALIAAVVGATALTSCNLDNDPSDNYFTNTYNCCNLVIPANGIPYATRTGYSISYYINSGEATVGTNLLNLGANNYSFVSPMMKAVTDYYNVNGQPLDVTSFSAQGFNQNGLVIKNLKGYTSSIVNIVSTNDPEVPDYTFTPYIPLVMSYTVNDDYTVKTFMKDAIYTGSTTINTVGEGESFTNDDIKMRVLFNDKLDKADVIFYNARFSQNMPYPITFVLKNLDVSYTSAGYNTAAGYKISNPDGQPVTPWMLEGSGLTEYPAYQFTSFEFVNTSENLTTGQAMYTVQIGQKQYLGTFGGSYVSNGK